MSVKTTVFVAIALSSLLLGATAYYFLMPASPGAGHSNPNGHNTVVSNPTNTQELVDASNLFALELFSNLSTPEGNLFFSPYSIFTALGMVYEGARCQTADEMRSVFHFPSDTQTRWSLFRSLIDKLNAANPDFNLSTANAIWVQKDFKLLDDYIHAVEDNYRAAAYNVDYINAVEDARVRINTWVEDHTNGKIKDLIPQGILDSDTRLVLTNAIYFKGQWVKTFNESDTKEKDFHPDSATTVKVQMMSRIGEEARFNYTSADGIQILQMPYASDRLSMMVLLPKSGTTASLEKGLTNQKLTQWRSGLKEQRVDVYFPKFKLETKSFLKPTLSSMGMPTAFSQSADFSGMDGKQDLYIGEVIHQAYVSVDEKGTEAAAATAVVMEHRSIGPAEPPITVFNADHPFLFLIQENDTGNILFMGKLVDPSKAG